MPRPHERTSLEISDVNCLCYTTHRLLKSLHINDVLQRRILGGLSTSEFSSILTHQAGTTLEDGKVKNIRMFYHGVYMMSLTIAPYKDANGNIWLNRKSEHPFQEMPPFDYLIRNQQAGLETIAYALYSKRLLILAENWGLDKSQIENVYTTMDRRIGEMLMFMGKALEVLFPTPKERSEWMQKSHPDFNNKAPVNLIGSGQFKDIVKVFGYLFQASNGAKSWTPKFDYEVEGEPLLRHRHQMKFCP